MTETEKMLPCGCDSMVVENAESCARCDDEDCGENGCERFQAFQRHALHTLNSSRRVVQRDAE